MCAHETDSEAENHTIMLIVSFLQQVSDVIFLLQGCYFLELWNYGPFPFPDEQVFFSICELGKFDVHLQCKKKQKTETKQYLYYNYEIQVCVKFSLS